MERRVSEGSRLPPLVSNLPISSGRTPSRSAMASSVFAWRSSGDTRPNCLGEFREIGESKQRTGIAPYGHPAGTPGATGVELRPRENGQGSDGGEQGTTD